MRCLIVLLLIPMLLLPALSAARAEEKATLVRCEYDEAGGMANMSISVTLKAGVLSDVLIIEGDPPAWPHLMRRQIHIAPKGSLKKLDDYISAHDPETWDDLPATELIALDAPMTRVTATWSDGRSYSVSDSEEMPGGTWSFLNTVETYMRSFAAKRSEDFTLSFSSFEGGGPEYSIEVEEPIHVDWTVAKSYGEKEEPLPPGSSYNVLYTFRGRAAGTTKVTVHASSPIAGDEDMVFTLSVDPDCNVTLQSEDPEQ
ncbi:MAG: hypothetical protein IJH78_07965 [Clostridia bacterium]|nr:hypothetical protein [Clostridia bacterium]